MGVPQACAAAIFQIPSAIRKHLGFEIGHPHRTIHHPFRHSIGAVPAFLEKGHEGRMLVLCIQVIFHIQLAIRNRNTHRTAAGFTKTPFISHDAAGSCGLIRTDLHAVMLA